MVGTSYKKDNSCSTKGSLFIHALWPCEDDLHVYIQGFWGEITTVFFPQNLEQKSDVFP